MNEDYGLSSAVVFIVKIDVAGVFFPDGNVWHCGSPLQIDCVLTIWMALDAQKAQ
jgi:hypothetical protein